MKWCNATGKMEAAACIDLAQYPKIFAMLVVN
jgi:hypothetical protein